MGNLTSRINRVVTAAALSSLVLLGGCRTSSTDLQRWATSDQGPSKLVAVMQHDKYPMPLRVQAALSLVGMKPRAGQPAGVDRMVETLAALPSNPRGRLIADLIPSLISELSKPPPAHSDTPDSTLAFKDAAYALVTHPGEPLIDPKTRAQIDGALIGWATTGFSRRLDDTSQKYGVVEVMHHLGAAGVAPLPNLMQPGVAKLDQLTSLVAELGDGPSKVAASERLVALARDVESPQWLQNALQPLLQGANTPPSEQARATATTLQSQELMRIFGAMKRLGQAPSVNYLLGLASDETKPPERRAAALAALEGQLEPKRGPQLDRLFGLADDPKTPALVRDLALRRMADLPRSEVASDLYRLFDSDQWKTRWLAAELLLRMSDAQHLSEFMDNLKSVRKLAMAEAKRYGALLAELESKAKQPAQQVAQQVTQPDPKPAATRTERDVAWAEAMEKYAGRSKPLAVRLTALGYYLASANSSALNGSDGPDVARYEHDATPIPRCEDEDPDCAWQCSFDSGGQTEEKKLDTVGDFVHFCVLPALRGRQGSPPPKP
jgi:hypothetical protein